MRFELTIRDEASLGAAAGLLRDYGIRAVNITDVSKRLDPVMMAGNLVRALPGLDVMPHLAAKHHDAASFRDSLVRAEAAGIGKLLVVSGFPRGTFDTLAALDVISVPEPGSVHAVRPYIVYNPYFDGDRLAVENARLTKKLEHAAVPGVCLQIGMDRKAFSEGVRLVRRLRSDAEVLASLPIPSESLLRRLKTKVLYGVHLDASYYMSADAAWRITQDMAKSFQEEGTEPVVFSDGFSREAIEKALSLS